MYPNSENHQQQISPRPFLSPGMKHSTFFSKTTNHGLTFSSKSQANLHLNSHLNPKKNEMTKSMIKKQPNDMDSFMKQMRQKMSTLERTLSQHNRQISQIRGSKTNSYYSSSDSFFKSDPHPQLTPQVLKHIKKQLQKDDLRVRTNIYSEIEYIKSQLQTNYTKKSDLDHLFHKFQLNISQLVNNTNVTKEINEIKNKIRMESENLHHYITQEINSKVQYLHDYNVRYSNDINACVESIKASIEGLRQDQKGGYVPSQQKCYSVKVVKSTETLQKLGGDGVQNSGEVVVVGQVMYYLDPDGYLLDSNHYYLLDRNNKQVKMDQKQIALFAKHHLI